jgi:predicted dehydrogenase
MVSKPTYVGGIGFGMQGPGNMRNFLGISNVQWVAVCDIDELHLQSARDIVNKRYGNNDCATYKDFRALFARGDLDAVSIAIPDHWHVIVSISALHAGLDVYGEKPLTHSVYEARVLTEEARKYKVMTQMGNQGHSGEGVRLVQEWIEDGAIGKVREVHCWTNRPIWAQGMPRPADTPPVPSMAPLTGVERLVKWSITRGFNALVRTGLV